METNPKTGIVVLTIQQEISPIPPESKKIMEDYLERASSSLTCLSAGGCLVKMARIPLPLISMVLPFMLQDSPWVSKNSGVNELLITLVVASTRKNSRSCSWLIERSMAICRV